MARPRKGAPRPDTELVAFRLSRSLIASLDAYAERLGGTRSDAVRDLLTRAIAAFPPTKAPRSAETRRAAKTRPRSKRSKTGERVVEPCAWCLAPAGEEHLDECPHHEASGLRELLLGKPRPRRKTRGKPKR